MSRKILNINNNSLGSSQIWQKKKSEGSTINAQSLGNTGKEYIKNLAKCYLLEHFLPFKMY